MPLQCLSILSNKTLTFLHVINVIDKNILEKDNLETTLHVLSFVCIYFCDLKKIAFRGYLFLRIASFWKFREYLFQTQRKKNKKKKVELRDIRLMFLSRSTKRQAGHEWKVIVIDSKKSWINQRFCEHIFRVFVFTKYEFYVYLAWIYFRERRLKTIRVYLILWSQLKFAKFTKKYIRQN